VKPLASRSGARPVVRRGSAGVGRVVRPRRPAVVQRSSGGSAVVRVGSSGARPGVL